MSSHPDPPGKPPLRRRIPLELTSEQLALLEREERRFGTKRATLVAGLEALSRLLGLEEELEQRARERDEARAQVEKEATRAKKAEATLGKAKDEAGSAKQEKAAAERRRQASQQGAQAQIEELSEELQEERETRLRLEDELEQLEAELVAAIHCPRCGKWAPAKEWGSRADGKFKLLFHRPCGFHPNDGLRGRSVIGYRRS